MQYVCAHGHEITTPEPLTIDRCLAHRHGAPCHGELKAHTAEGCRAENARLRELAARRELVTV